MKTHSPPAVMFVVGPTASGKHSVAMELATNLGGEILSLDSMKVYRGMDVGTAKASPILRAKVPHHLIDIVDPPQEFSVSEYLDLAILAAGDILARGKVPIFAGGTGLYLRVLVRGMFRGPGTSLEVREFILEGNPPTPVLHERLATIDPARADQIHPNDRRRIVRALEVYHVSGRPMSDHLSRVADRALEHPHIIFGLERDPADTSARIDVRTPLLFERGFVEEVARLHGDPSTRPGRQASKAVGYPEVLAHLETETPLEDCIEAVKKSTRGLARKQRTWWRSFSEIVTVPVEKGDTARGIASRIEDVWTAYMNGRNEAPHT